MSLEMTAVPGRAGGTRERVQAWATRVHLGRKLAVALTVAALSSGVVTYAALSGWLPYGTDPRSILVLLNIDLVLFLLLGAVVARRLVVLWLERRRGSAGSKLHSRLVLLFSLVALAPAVIVSVFSAVFFSLGMQAWFSERVRTVLQESHAVAQSYLEEHQQAIRGDVLAMARDLSRSAHLLSDYPFEFHRLVAAQGELRSLTEAIVFDSGGRVLSRWRLSYVLNHEDVPMWAIERARAGEVVLLARPSDDRIRAIVKLDYFIDSYLYVSRFVDASVLAHIDRLNRAVDQYESLEGRRSSFEITFAMMFVLVALLLLLAAVWVGLAFATQLARPVSALVEAAERVRAGDLKVRVPEGLGHDELGTLSRAFNRMTHQLESQRSELVEANRQLDARRHFTETVLAGVSAGVVGLDAEGRINMPNRSASVLLATDLQHRIGQPLAAVAPELAPLLAAARAKPSRLVEAQQAVSCAGRSRTLLVRIVAERSGGRIRGFVVTFDDVTALLAAQRKAAWADVARRIAHEIKNPLTPIQLSAERLNRKYLKEIVSDPETFRSCTETIIRQVGDIGRMVDEFSNFARMPAPDMRGEDLGEIVRRAIQLQRNARPDIEFREILPARAVRVSCDARQIGQALTNLLQNALDAIEARGNAAAGRIEVALSAEGGHAAVVVADNGKGLPESERERLTEPYVTTRAKGTGLGLAIVKKIVEDHGGELALEDRPEGGARIRLTLPLAGGASPVRHAAEALSDGA